MKCNFLFCFLFVISSIFGSVTIKSGVANVAFEKTVPDTLYNYPLLKSIKFNGCLFDTIKTELFFFKELIELSFESCPFLKDVQFTNDSKLTRLSFSI